MNHPYIREICNAYYNDMQLAKTKIWKDKDQSISELFNEIVGLMNNLYLEDSAYYFEMFNLGTGQQQKVIYSLLNEFMDYKYQFFGESVDIDLANYDSAEAFLLESFSGGVGQLIGAVSNIPGGAISAGLGALGTVGAAAATNPALAVVGAAASIIALIAAYKQISRAGWSTLSALNSANKAIAEFVHNKTRSGRVKRAVLVNNLDACFKKCNIDPNNVSRWAGMALTNDLFSTPKAQSQANCLAYCYLNWSLDQVGLLSKGYVDCLKATGERGNELSDISIFIKPPVGACKDYFDIIKRHHTDFIDAIEVIFQKETDVQNEWRKKYEEELNKALNYAPSINNARRPDFKNNTQRFPKRG